MATTDTTIDKVIDAPSAGAEEFHNQTTHIWFTADAVGGGLELLFDFGQAFDISTLHFWNYTGESFDVENVDFTFFNQSNVQVGALSVQPARGPSGLRFYAGTSVHGTPIGIHPENLQIPRR